MLNLLKIQLNGLVLVIMAVIGRSPIVSVPLSAYLIQKNNTEQVFVSITLALQTLINLFIPRKRSAVPLTLVTLFGLLCTTVLFPPLSLPPPSGPHKVGVVDTYIPLSSPSHSSQDYVNVRVLYPTVPEVANKDSGYSRPPYLSMGSEICAKFMEFGAPPFLKSFGFLLHFWKLVEPHFYKDAPVAPIPTSLPVVVYSHGLGGTASLYSTQSTSLASHGYVVMLVEHSDGSAPLTMSQSGKIIEHYKDIYKLRNDTERGIQWDTPDYVRGRREQLLVRIEEVVETAKWAKSAFNPDSTSKLPPAIAPLRGKLDVSKGVHLVGHSFGGATVLSAGGKHGSSIFRSVVAHDPAVDWMSDETRYNLLKNTKYEGTGGYEGGVKAAKANESKGLESLPLSMIYCSNWVDINFGHSEVTIPGVNSGEMGKKGGEASVVDDSMHFEFSDNSLIMPHWLGKGLEFTKGEPERVAAEVAKRTL
eukprot:CAMPEP_0118646164 /NCGR_PEP_ID=MMETSP0785-20121206/7904_1 /TAXON_ID=91992 /ORGANISM="Bolidomonas pacifica, Strain CCMP 1866" /LENGTH=474 /DNA_ID=CAMNT_0006538127 /DNA_START=115 /DNA_END=1536 /DNA_ORIENTATION=+